jgi:hypothetical protein
MAAKVSFRRHLLRDGGGARMAVCGVVDPRYFNTDPAAVDCPRCLDRHRRQNGTGALWIVTTASPVSTLADICFQVTPRDFAMQIRGGLAPDEILGWFDDASEANQIALQELHRAGADQYSRGR